MHSSVGDHDRKAIHSSIAELLKQKAKNASRRSHWRSSVQCSLGAEGILYGAAEPNGFAVFAGVRGHCQFGQPHFIGQILQKLIEEVQCLRIDPTKPKAAVVSKLMKSMHEHMSTYNKHVTQCALIDCEEEDEGIVQGIDATRDSSMDSEYKSIGSASTVASSWNSDIQNSRRTGFKRVRFALGL
jgi:hypothetical protein